MVTTDLSAAFNTLSKSIIPIIQETGVTDIAAKLSDRKT